jgi:hypothetical protein
VTGTQRSRLTSLLSRFKAVPLMREPYGCAQTSSRHPLLAVLHPLALIDVLSFAPSLLGVLLPEYTVAPWGWDLRWFRVFRCGAGTWGGGDWGHGAGTCAGSESSGAGLGPGGGEGDWGHGAGTCTGSELQVRDWRLRWGWDPGGGGAGLWGYGAGTCADTRGLGPAMAQGLQVGSRLRMVAVAHSLMVCKQRLAWQPPSF